MLWFMIKSDFTTKKNLIGHLIKYPELRLLYLFDATIPIILTIAVTIFGVIFNIYTNPNGS
jgi:hypothetical protein